MTDSLFLTPEALVTLTNQELIAEWMKTTRESGDLRMDALKAEVDRRGLNI